MELFGGAHTYMPTHSHTTHTQLFPGLLARGESDELCQVSRSFYSDLVKGKPSAHTGKQNPSSKPITHRLRKIRFLVQVYFAWKKMHQ
jgi:hypothetical protein